MLLTLRSIRIAAFSLVAIVAVGQTPAKRPIHHRDYDAWRTIQTQILSRDGKYLAYALFPEEGDGEVVVRNLATGKEIRENAGAIPPAPDTTDFETPAAGGPAAVRSLRMLFSADGHYLVSASYPPKGDTDKAKKEKKRPDEMPRQSMLIFDTAAGTASRVADVASFQLPENGPAILGYLKGAKPGEAPATAENEDQEDQRRGGAAGAAGAGRGRTPLYGSDFVLRDLPSAKERTVADVTEFTIAKDGKLVAYAVASKTDDGNGVYTITPGTEAGPSTLLAGKGKYSKLTWDPTQKQMAFLSTKGDTGRAAKYKVYLWDRKPNAPTEILSAATPGFKQGFSIAERGTINFSRDGSRLFVACVPGNGVDEAPPAVPGTTSTPGVNDDKVVADLWRWNDDYVQPMQKVRSAQDRARTYRAVVHLSDRNFLQLSDETMSGLTPNDDGRYALGTDDRELRHMVDYDGNYVNLYLVDTMTGARKLVFEKHRGGGGGGGGPQGGGAPAGPWSPDGKYAVEFRENQWFTIAVPDGKVTNITAKMGSAFHNEDHDSPGAPASYGAAGWTKDSKWTLVYDRYDVWAVAPDGSTGHRLTDGRLSNLQFRLARLDRNEGDEERGIDPSKPLLFRVENLETRDTGFYSMANMNAGTPKKLMMGAKNYRALAKAKDADVVLVTATTFREQPDLQVTDSTFGELKKVTDSNPQQAKMLWGSGELIKYRNDDGVELQAALYKPENFNPSRKYPMMIYIYERLSQNVHTFVRPAPGTSINIAYYVSNGYLVLTPDIIYTTGHPGQSALKCVMPAIQAVVEKGYVDRKAIGIQGHSWGGYQTAYLVTQTNLFRAAEAGAPVVNMTSAYNGIRWGTGLPRQFQYEKTQSRIGGTLWEYPLRFFENSPLFNLDRVTTPMLILHNDGDDAVPWYQGIEFFLSMRRLGKEAYLFNYNGEPHGLRRRPDQKDFTVRMQQFFDHFLKDAATPAWMQKGIPYNEREKEKEKFGAVYSETGDTKK